MKLLRVLSAGWGERTRCSRCAEMVAVRWQWGCPWRRGAHEPPAGQSSACSGLTPPPLSLRRVVQNVVLLSDSRLHLFLQSQLSVPEIEACVQGQGSRTVTDAILHYAMSNCGWAQEEQSRPALLPGDPRPG